MSILDSYRATAERETDKANKLQKDIASYQRDKARKHIELSRTKQTSRAQTLTKDIQRLDDKIARAQKDLGAAQEKATDYNQKVAKEEQKLRDQDEKARKTAERVQQRLHDEMRRSLKGTSTQVEALDSRLTRVETALLDSVREAVINDPVEREFDVFLSHTYPDREIAEEFYREMHARGLQVWFDGAEIVLGQSLTRQIDRGIAKSRVAVILVTEEFVKGRLWMEREMGGFFASRKRVIPVLDGVSREDLAAYSPLLADIVGLSTEEEGFDLLAEKMVQTISVEAISRDR